jgi:uncharacterized protein YjbI with pentapeptide repeats
MDNTQLKNRWKNIEEKVIDNFRRYLSDMDAFDICFAEYLVAMSDGKERFDLRGINLSKQHIEGGYYADFDLSFGSFHDANLNKPSFANCILEQVDFTQCILSKGGFHDCVVSLCNFQKSNISDFVLAGVDFMGCTFDKSVFENVNLSFADLSTCSFKDTKGVNVNLYKAKLSKSQKLFDWWKGSSDDSIIWVDS